MEHLANLVLRGSGHNSGVDFFLDFSVDGRRSGDEKSRPISSPSTKHSRQERQHQCKHTSCGVLLLLATRIESVAGKHAEYGGRIVGRKPLKALVETWTEEKVKDLQTPTDHSYPRIALILPRRGAAWSRQFRMNSTSHRSLLPTLHSTEQPSREVHSETLRHVVSRRVPPRQRNSESPRQRRDSTERPSYFVV
jgi:hypothetical protein